MTKNLKFLSVCSGIEAASVAWNPLGWEAVAFSEIEKFPSAVLEYRYPDIPNLGDMTKIDTAALGHVDIFSGGTPCQAFSIAGLRNSLDDARGNLSLEFVRIAHELAAGNGLRNVVWENVPGVLSTKDNAFGCFLGGLVGADDAIPPPRGTKWPNAGMVSGPKGRAAWRILDAQFFGLAQRRKRVIVVADFGNGADPAAVLFERKGMHGNSPPSRETRERIAPTISARTKGGGGLGTDFDLDGGLIHAPEIARCVATREGSSQDYETTTMVAQTYAIQERAVSDNLENGPQGKGYQPDVAYTLEARNKVQAVCATGEISHTLKAEGFDASEDGTGRGTPIVVHGTQDPCTSDIAFAQQGNSGQENVVMVFDPNQVSSRTNRSIPKPEISHTLPAAANSPICFTAKDYGGDAAVDVAPTLRSGTHDKSHANGGVVPAVTVALRGRDGGGTAELGGSVATALRASSGGGDKPHVLTPAVRRLTPRECERLMGFPDNYTLIPVGKKLKDDAKEELAAYFERTGQYMKEVSDGEWVFDRNRFEDAWPAMSADGPRYKALGNSWAVPLFVWLGERITRLMPAAHPVANDNAKTSGAA